MSRRTGIDNLYLVGKVYNKAKWLSKSLFWSDESLPNFNHTLL